MSATVVRDPIHGMVELRPNEWRVVDTTLFQRLRLVRQLALTSLIYPGALHTRFEHSIGVLSVADRLMAKLGFQEDDVKVGRAAALTHDVGHGVFSHVSEQAIGELNEVDGVHESVAAHLLRTRRELRRPLGAEVCDRAADLVEKRGARTALRDIVNGPADADKLDYLLRDSYFAGVHYGRYDLPRLIESARRLEDPSLEGLSQLGFEADAVWAVEEMLMARHHMHRQVYGHKTRLATDIMLIRALKLAVEEGVVESVGYRVESDDRRPRITDDFLEAYLRQTDDSVLRSIVGSRGSPALRDLASRLVNRQLLRRGVAIRLDERVEQLGRERYANIRDPEYFGRSRVTAIEQRLAEELEVPAHLVAVHLDSRTNPTYIGPTRSGKRDEIYFEAEEGVRALHQESEIFHSVDEEVRLAAEHTWIYLYTPRMNKSKTKHAEERLWNELLTV